MKNIKKTFCTLIFTYFLNAHSQKIFNGKITYALTKTIDFSKRKDIELLKKYNLITDDLPDIRFDLSFSGTQSSFYKIEKNATKKLVKLLIRMNLWENLLRPLQNISFFFFIIFGCFFD